MLFLRIELSPLAFQTSAPAPATPKELKSGWEESNFRFPFRGLVPKTSGQPLPHTRRVEVRSPSSPQSQRLTFVRGASEHCLKLLRDVGSRSRDP